MLYHSSASYKAIYQYYQNYCLLNNAANVDVQNLMFSVDFSFRIQLESLQKQEAEQNEFIEQFMMQK